MYRRPFVVSLKMLLVVHAKKGKGRSSRVLLGGGTLLAASLLSFSFWT